MPQVDRLEPLQSGTAPSATRSARIVGLFALCIGAALFPARLCAATPAGDACAAIGLQDLRPPAARVEIDREAAEKIVVHLGRACALIVRLQTNHPEPSVTRPLTLVGTRLNAQVLAPIYRLHPDLRDLGDICEGRERASARPAFGPCWT